jgi:hypothetical protein
MVPRAPPVVAPPPVFKPDWETLIRLVSTPSKLLDLNTCSTPTSLRRFCGATDKLKPTWFWGPNQETVAVILRPKSPNQSCRFEPQTGKPSTTLILRLNQETHAPSLHVPAADRTRRHPTSRLPGHRVFDLCDRLRSSAPDLLLLPWSSSLDAMPHLPPAHHEISKRDSPNETKIKEKQNKTIPDLNSNFTKSMTHHNQTKELITWFLRDLDSVWIYWVFVKSSFQQ